MRIAFSYGYQGVSGEIYTFVLIDLTSPKALPWHGGIFVFSEYAPEPLYIGESPYLVRAIMECQRKTLADHIRGIRIAYVLIEDDPKKRAAVMADLVEMYRPPLNRQK